MTTFAKALRKELGHVDERNWRDSLDALHAEEGSWKRVAERLGTNRRTVERWRYGYRDRHGSRRSVSSETISKHALPKISNVFRGSRAAQLRRVDWSRMSMKGHLSIGGGEYERDENMSPGRYLDDEDIEQIGQAYLDGSDARLQGAIDSAMSGSYIGDGATSLTDVSWLRF